MGLEENLINERRDDLTSLHFPQIQRQTRSPLPLTITSIQDEFELRQLRDYLLTQPNFYGGHYYNWIDDKCIPRIVEGSYQNLIALSEGTVVGDCIYASPSPGTVFIKHFRVGREWQDLGRVNGRGVGRFLLQQIFAEYPESEFELDTTVSNFPAVSFFIHSGFEPYGIEQRYRPGQDEYLMKKRARA